MGRGKVVVSLIFLLLVSTWKSPTEVLLTDSYPIQETVSDDVDGSDNYTVVYQLDIPDEAQYNNGQIPYSIDSSSSIDFTFDRVAYYLELEKPNQPRTWVFVSFPSITTNADELGIPTFNSGIVHNRLLTDVEIQSNHQNLSSLGTIDTGVIEFWGTNYGTADSLGVPNGNDSIYDIADSQYSADSAGYGSMQIHDYESGQTLFAYNAWGGSNQDDLGIGNNPDESGHPDWTFSSNAADYTLKSMTILVRPGPTPSELMITLHSPDDHQIVQRDEYNKGIFPVSGTTQYAVDLIEGRYIDLESSFESEWVSIAVPLSSNFYGVIEVPTGWHRLELRFMQDGNQLATQVINPVGVGEVFIVAGQSNSANHGDAPLTPTDSRVSTWGASGWRFGYDPQPAATGNSGSPWPVAGDLLAARYDVPIGFLSVGYGGTPVDRWVPEQNDLFSRITDALDAVEPSGARAILWHQGESNAGGTSAEDYARMLGEVVLGSREHAGYEIPWIVARVSFVPNGDSVKMGWIIEGQNAVIEDDPLTFPGPHTDDLNGTQWRYDTIHFNEAGLREHGLRWDAQISSAMDDLLHPILDSDSDGVIDDQDDCPDTPESTEVYIDGCSEEQRQPGSTTDADQDGIMDVDDLCQETPIGESVYVNGCSDSQLDTDSDGVSDAEDACPFFNDLIDSDFDSIPDGCDDLIDRDNDGVSDADDVCNNFDDTVDVDADDIPDGCDELIDSDGDGVSDLTDICNNHNDSIDIDSDGVPDGCDELIDSDNDGVADEFDICPEHDDAIDLDLDMIPDGCDDSIDIETEVKIEQNSMDSEEVRAVVAISVLILISILLIMLIRRGKPPANEQHRYFVEKQYTKF
ncbi:MAG: Alpha-agarase [Euryarchaeota archaeon UBA443]|nr:MAG: Alpha-agarase [Euryarchaeota archaeon UBA443]